MKEYKDEHRDRARREAEELLVRARKEVENIVKNIRETSADKEAVRSGHEKLRSLMAETEQPPAPPPAPKAGTVAIGDTVSLNANGEPSGRVVKLEGKNKRAVIEIAGKRLTVGVDRLYRIEVEDEEQKRVDVRVSVAPMESTTIDVRGETREMALERVDAFVDSAVLNGVQEIKVIHGIGTRVLLDAIRNNLRADTRVKSVRMAGGFDGGDGASVVVLK